MLIGCAQRDEAGLAFHVGCARCFQSERGGQSFNGLFGFDGEPVARRNSFEQFDGENLFALFIVEVGLGPTPDRSNEGNRASVVQTSDRKERRVGKECRSRWWWYRRK